MNYVLRVIVYLSLFSFSALSSAKQAESKEQVVPKQQAQAENALQESSGLHWEFDLGAIAFYQKALFLA